MKIAESSILPRLDVPTVEFTLTHLLKDRMVRNPIDGQEVSLGIIAQTMGEHAVRRTIARIANDVRVINRVREGLSGLEGNLNECGIRPIDNGRIVSIAQQWGVINHLGTTSETELRQVPQPDSRSPVQIYYVRGVTSPRFGNETYHITAPLLHVNDDQSSVRALNLVGCINWSILDHYQYLALANSYEGQQRRYEFFRNAGRTAEVARSDLEQGVREGRIDGVTAMVTWAALVRSDQYIVEVDVNDRVALIRGVLEEASPIQKAWRQLGRRIGHGVHGRSS